MSMNVLQALNWRYATKKFDPSKKVSDADMLTIREVLRLTPSSYGLQPLKYLIIENSDLRRTLRQHAYDQSQITDASHLIVICAYNDIGEDDIDAHIDTIATVRNTDIAGMSGYAEFMKRTIVPMPEETKLSWNTNQAYIALGQLLLALAVMEIDATPMEGFDNKAFDALLGLPEQNLHAVLLCPIGYRSPDDQAQFNKKVRKTENELFETL